MMEWLTEKTLKQVLKEKRVMEAAAAAGIKAKVAKLNMLQELEQEELKVKQQKERLLLESELALVKARNKVLEEYEAGRKVSKSPIVSGNWGANRQSVNYHATYNGIGLTTPRGSGTYGWVQRNWTLVEKSKDKVNYKTEEDLEKIDSAGNKQPNSEILDHEHKRRIEEKRTELEAVVEHQGYIQDEVETKVSAYRTLLMANDSKLEEQARDEYGRIIVRGTHQEKITRLREAFVITAPFKDVTEPLEDARSGNDINVDTKKYPPSPTRNVRVEPKKEKKNTKRNKRDRTQSSRVSSRKKTKNKAKYKKKRKKNVPTSSSSADADSSSESDNENEDSSNAGKKKSRKKKLNGKGESKSVKSRSRNKNAFSDHSASDLPRESSIETKGKEKHKKKREKRNTNGCHQSLLRNALQRHQTDLVVEDYRRESGTANANVVVEASQYLLREEVEAQIGTERIEVIIGHQKERRGRRLEGLCHRKK
ncbi:uncharacterized protein [Rhodnius prolixus]|uniref:uncharacterized protein n=1 Tax=Rhodnius prolixus TaxID=13249 RepID=UPI003D18ACD8